MIPWPHAISKHALHFLRHLPLTEEILFLVTAASFSLALVVLVCVMLFRCCHRSDESDQEVPPLPLLHGCFGRFWTAAARRQSSVREFATLEDFFLQVEANERGRVSARRQQEQQDAVDVEASLDAFFPNILENDRKTKKATRNRSRREVPDGTGEGEEGDHNDNEEEPLL